MIRKMWLVTFVDFCYGWSLWVFLTWLPSFFSDTYKVDLKKMALFATLTLMAGFIGDTLGGVLSDFIYRRTGSLRLARLSLLMGGLGGSSLLHGSRALRDERRDGGLVAGRRFLRH